jgi:hypothetical protein
MSGMNPLSYDPNGPITPGPMRSGRERVSPWSSWTIWMLAVLALCAAGTWVAWSAYDSWGDAGRGDAVTPKAVPLAADGVLAANLDAPGRVTDPQVLADACATTSERLDLAYGAIDRLPTWSYARVATDRFRSAYSCVRTVAGQVEVRPFTDGRVLQDYTSYDVQTAARFGVRPYHRDETGTTPRAERASRNVIPLVALGAPVLFMLLSLAWLGRRPSLGRRVALWLPALVGWGLLGAYASSRGDADDVPTLIAITTAGAGLFLVLLCNGVLRRVPKPSPAPALTSTLPR